MTREQLYGIVGATFFCLIILIILFFSVLRTIIPQEEAGVLVRFGNVNLAAGTFEPFNTGSARPVVEIPPPLPVAQTPDQPAITQDMEETVSVADAQKKKEEEKKREEQRRVEEEQKRIADAEAQHRAEEARRQQAIQDQVAGAFGTGGATGSHGTAASGIGNQGSPFGNSNQGADSGVGGYGEFSLAGRTTGAGGLPRPAYIIQEEGRIVVNITVNPNGDVISVAIGRGTDIDNAQMRQSALEAANKAKFNSIRGTTNQSGTITYRYNLK